MNKFDYKRVWRARAGRQRWEGPGFREASGWALSAGDARPGGGAAGRICRRGGFAGRAAGRRSSCQSSHFLASRQKARKCEPRRGANPRISSHLVRKQENASPAVPSTPHRIAADLDRKPTRNRVAPVQSDIRSIHRTKCRTVCATRGDSLAPWQGAAIAPRICGQRRRHHDAHARAC